MATALATGNSRRRPTTPTIVTCPTETEALRTLTDLVLLARPHQWIKNLFVFIGLLFGHAWTDPASVRQALLAFAGFCLVSSGVYVFNDLIDRRVDGNHPRKKSRPIACGRISTVEAIVLSAALSGAGLAVGAIGSQVLLALLGGYVVLNVTYSLWLKHKVLFDVFAIASGFMLRILAGTVGIGIPPSRWLLLCGMMVTLFLGFTKRRAEVFMLKDGRAPHRPVLEHYSPALLDKMIDISATCVIMSYSLYTMSPETVAAHGTPNLIYTVPFVVFGIFRFIYLLHDQYGGHDASLDLGRDIYLAAAVFAWLLTTVWLIA
jgi:4-hydroxybenzoate polyprenyltransferase